MEVKAVNEKESGGRKKRKEGRRLKDRRKER
jgi:hypothetical protein